jgi:hypothetical protein
VPDLVIHAIFTDNDVADGHPGLAGGEGAPFATLTSANDLSIDYSAAEDSYRSYTREPIYSLRRFSAGYDLISTARWRLKSAGVGKSTRREGIPKSYGLYAVPLMSTWEEAWIVLESVVNKFGTEVRQNGGEFLVVSVPAPQVVYTHKWETVKRAYPAMYSRDWNLRAPESRLKQIAEASGWTFVSPLDAFVAANEGPPLYFDFDGHLTPEGHAVVAKHLEGAVLPFVIDRQKSRPISIAEEP